MKLEETMLKQATNEELKRLLIFLEEANNKKEVIQKLKEVVDAFQEIKSKQASINTVKKMIKKREKKKKTLDERFSLEMISTFNLEDKKVLVKNNLHTVADLRKKDISKLKGITEATKESLTWASEFYHLDR